MSEHEHVRRARDAVKCRMDWVEIKRRELRDAQSAFNKACDDYKQAKAELDAAKSRPMRCDSCGMLSPMRCDSCGMLSPTFVCSPCEALKKDKGLPLQSFGGRTGLPEDDDANGGLSNAIRSREG